jgi:hypothetical protein
MRQTSTPFPLTTLTALIALVASTAPLACGSGAQSMPNPLVRVDLSQRIDAKTRRLLPAAIDLDCHVKLTLGDPNVAQQTFVVNWRVADLKGKRYLTAVDVAPAAGPTKGSASAAVGMASKDGTKLPVTLHWKFQQGCSDSVSQAKRFELSTTHASCKGSQPTNLLRKVK